MPPSRTSTRDRLLAAAERLLLEGDYDSLSLRAVCADAEANVAAVHYHFGGKDGLVATLLQERLGPVWEDSLAALVDAATLADCVHALIDPLADLAREPGGRMHLHLLARLVLGRRDVAWAAEWFSLAPWVDLLQARVPGITTREAEVRWMLAFDLVLTQFGDPLGGGRALSRAATATIHRFVTAGLAAEVHP
ncbi:TetR/AcrR family transcriptional regulator [Nocardioides alcanivorans]|uniref:TetR/AcrR family transcriptional regulator n=1 Tax=Nocardioides alcanivorans TaxID=2897352 RepID=UPI001F195B3C|nr:TetR family transcriptional regulator [Nocardioides alcanivorans]